MTINELLQKPKGTILQKGKRRRIYQGTDGIFIMYTTPSRKKHVTGESLLTFKNWLKDAVEVTDE